MLGCLGTVLFVVWADIGRLVGGAGGTDVAINKAFARGVSCNALVCLAVWLAIGVVADKILDFPSPPL